MQDNGMDVPGNWQDQMFHLACEHNPNIECEDTENIVRVVTGQDIWRFLTAVWGSMESGAKPVSEEEAERRADICLVCPKRGFTPCLSGGCGKLAEVVTTLTLGRKIKHHEALHKASCGVCSCEINTLINWPLDVLSKVDEKTGFKKDEFPEACWRRS